MGVALEALFTAEYAFTFYHEIRFVPKIQRQKQRRVEHSSMKYS